MKPGYRTTELYLVIATMLPWLSGQLGADLSKILGKPEDIAQIITDAHAQSSTAPIWVTGIYVAARFFLKWQEIKSK